MPKFHTLFFIVSVKLFSIFSLKFPIGRNPNLLWNRQTSVSVLYLVNFEQPNYPLTLGRAIAVQLMGLYLCHHNQWHKSRQPRTPLGSLKTGRDLAQDFCSPPAVPPISTPCDFVSHRKYPCGIQKLNHR